MPGAVIRGETDHYEYVCAEAARGIQDVQLRTGVPCSFGVLTVENMDQALARAGGGKRDQGEHAAEAVMALISAIAAVVVALVAPAAAAAESVWTGKTKQGRGVVVRTGEDGHVSRARIGWRARCDNGGTYSSRTIFVEPLDSATATGFADTGNYRAKPHGYAARIRVSIEGSWVAATDRWRGTFSVRVRVVQDGELSTPAASSSSSGRRGRPDGGGLAQRVADGGEGGAAVRARAGGGEHGGESLRARYVVHDDPVRRAGQRERREQRDRLVLGEERQQHRHSLV